MSEHMIHANMILCLSELMLHTEMCNFRSYARIRDGFCLNLCNVRKYNMSEPKLHTKI